MDVVLNTTSMQGFDVNWLLSEVQKEVAASEQALLALQHEIAAFLPPPSPSTSHADRPRRALPLAAAAVGAIGLFGTGIAWALAIVVCQVSLAPVNPGRMLMPLIACSR